MSFKGKLINGVLALAAAGIILPASPVWADAAKVFFYAPTHTATTATFDSFQIKIGPTPVEDDDTSHVDDDADANDITIGLYNETSTANVVVPAPVPIAIEDGVNENPIPLFSGLIPNTQYTFIVTAQDIVAPAAAESRALVPGAGNKSDIFRTGYLRHTVSAASDVTDNDATVVVRLYSEDATGNEIPFAGADTLAVDYALNGIRGGSPIPAVNGISTEAFNISGVLNLTLGPPTLGSMTNYSLAITGINTNPAWENYYNYVAHEPTEFTTAPAPDDVLINAEVVSTQTTSRVLTADVWLTYPDAGAQVLDTDINGELIVELVRATDGDVIASNVAVEIDDGEGRVTFLNGIDPGTTYYLRVTDVSELTPVAAPATYAKWVGYEHSSVDRLTTLAPDGSSSAGGGGGSGGSTPSDDDDDDDVTPPQPGTTVVTETPAADGAFEAVATITTESGAAVTSVVVDTTADVIKQLSDIGLNVTVAGNELKISGTAKDIGVFDIPVTVNGTESQTVRVEIKAIEHTDEVFVDTTPANVGLWPTELTTSGNATRFVTYIPTSLTAGSVDQISVTATGITGATATLENPLLASGRGAGEKRFKVEGTVTDYEKATIDSISYRVGINRYTQATNVKLSSTAVTGTLPSSPDGGKSSGGGCDVGLGLFGLMTAAGAMTLLRKKG